MTELLQNTTNLPRTQRRREKERNKRFVSLCLYCSLISLYLNHMKFLLLLLLLLRCVRRNVKCNRCRVSLCRCFLRCFAMIFHCDVFALIWQVQFSRWNRIYDSILTTTSFYYLLDDDVQLNQHNKNLTWNLYFHLFWLFELFCINRSKMFTIDCSHSRWWKEC